ncbi:MAG TPA: PAS domain S-box protein, partial [Bacteroidota bacterium]|nr:PAS domain S-box protein [Bacteroidota bacterium]
MSENKRVQYVKTAAIGVIGIALSFYAFSAIYFISVEETWHSWGFFLVGLCFTGLTIGFLLLNIRQTRQVGVRAEELWKTAEDLRREVAEHKQTVMALRKSEARYRALFETSPDAITIFDLDFNIEAVNQRALQILGYEKPEAVVGRKVSDFVVPEERKRAEEGLRKRIEAGSITDAEFSMLKKDGSRSIVLGRASVIRDAKGDPEAIIAVSH